MSTEKKATNYRIIGLLVGLIVSYPISYYFQPDAVRVKLTMANYISHITDVVGDSNLRSAVIMSLIGCTIVGGVIGHLIDKNASKSDKE